MTFCIELFWQIILIGLSMHAKFLSNSLLYFKLMITFFINPIIPTFYKPRQLCHIIFNILFRKVGSFLYSDKRLILREKKISFKKITLIKNYYPTNVLSSLTLAKLNTLTLHNILSLFAPKNWKRSKTK